MPRSDDSSDNDRHRSRRRRRSSSSDSSSESSNSSRDVSRSRSNNRRRSRSKEKVERWPKDGYEALRKDNFQRRQGGGNYHNDRRRNQGFGEEYMEHRRKQREEICERGAHEVWGKSPSREELVYNSSEDEKVSNDSSSENEDLFFSTLNQ